jgi:hypothetical protein
MGLSSGVGLSAEAVAYSKHRLDIARVAWVWLDLGAQIANVHVNGAFETVNSNPLHLFEQREA